MAAEFAHCRALVADESRDRAMSLVFAPQERRDDLSALYAFDVETARIRDRISEPMPGEIRLQWWRDALSGDPGGTAGEGAGGHPVAGALRDVIARHELPRAVFDRLLEARIFDLYDDPMPSRVAFEAYAGETASTLIMLAARVLSPASANEIADAAGHAGVATMVADCLRLLPVHRARGQVYLPADLLSAAGCSAEDLLKGRKEPSARAVEAMAAMGLDHARTMEKLLPAVPRDVRAAFLPASLSRPLLRKARKAGSRTLETPVDLSPVRKSFHFWRTMRA